MIGSPVAHSKSPLLHAAAYRSLGVDCSYTAIDVPGTRLPGFLGEVRRTPGWRGLSVTMPLKPGVALLADATSGLAAVLGVANTVVVDRSGDEVRLTAHNTDAAGISNALAAAGVGAPTHAAILGGGGTAAAAVAGLAALGTRSAAVLVRRPDAAVDLLRIGAAVGLDVVILPWSAAEEHVRTAGVVVSTLPPRAADPLARDLAADPGFRTRAALLDVAYDPWPSGLATSWRNAGGTIVPGLDMLLHQAVEQVLLFFPAAAQDRGAVLEAMCDAVGGRRH